MEIKQLFDYSTWTYSYLIYEKKSREAAIIDSVKEQFQRDKTYIVNLDLKLKYAFETHVHADHVTAAGMMRDEFNTETVVHKNSGVKCASLMMHDGQTFQLGDETIRVLFTPGHTNTCVTFVIDGAIFSGDSLLIGGCGRTDFQAGDAATLYESITTKLFTMPDDIVVYPGHDYNGFTASSIAEEKAFNPRLGNNRSKVDFIKIMDSLDLPNPARMDVAIPGNLACGKG